MSELSFDIKEFLDRMASEVTPKPTPSPQLLRRARRRRVRTVTLATVVAVVLAFGGVAGVRALTRPAPIVPVHPGACSWQLVPSPNEDPSTYYNFIRKVAAVSNQDAWAIGTFYVAGEGGRTGNLILHWDGTRWSIVPHPNGGTDSTLLDAAAVSSNDVWTVGFGSGVYRGLVERWNGKNWSLVLAADPGTTYWHFEGVAAAGQNDVWAVGNTAKPGGTLIEHWDGKAWTIVSNPSAPSRHISGTLDAIAVVSSNDVWAVGEANSGVSFGSTTTLIEHWDGSRWAVVPSPSVVNNQGVPYDHLLSVAASSPRDVWAVGIHGDKLGTGGSGDHLLIEHFDGTAWRVVDAPAPGVWNRFYGVSASHHGVWAVGSEENESGSRSGGLIEHWTGSAWTVVRVPAAPNADLMGVALLPSGNVWAVGSFTSRRVQKTLSLLCT